MPERYAVRPRAARRVDDVDVVQDALLTRGQRRFPLRRHEREYRRRRDPYGHARLIELWRIQSARRGRLDHRQRLFRRLGAAVRHATRQLARQSAGHRLLLILSDGRPNDVDRYQGPYGVEDSRQAIFEARASGVYPFCITVDHQASEYLPRIFGAAGHTIVQRPEQLPTALLTVVQALIRRG